MVEARVLSLWRVAPIIADMFSQSDLVVEHIILRQRAAVHVPDGGFGSRGASFLKGSVPVLLAVGHGGNGVDQWLRGRLGRPAAAAVRLAVDAVQVLGNVDASSVQQELGQEVTLSS